MPTSRPRKTQSLRLLRPGTSYDILADLGGTLVLRVLPKTDVKGKQHQTSRAYRQDKKEKEVQYLYFLRLASIDT